MNFMSKTDNKDISYLAVLLEHTTGQNQAILEVVGDIQKKVSLLPTREELDELKDDVKVIVTDTSRQVHDHEHRITRLEAKAA
jgi:hypothetical protein